MQTWLDWYVNNVVTMAKDHAKSEGRSLSMTDHDTFANVAKASLHLVLNNDPEYSQHNGYDFGWFMTHIAAFAGFGNSPFAVKVDAESVRDLRNAPISDDVRDFGRGIRSRYPVAYLDVADRAYSLEGGYQLRGLFIFQGEEREHFCAVITRPGSNNACRLAWSEGHHARNLEDSVYDQVWAMGSHDCRGEQHFDMREFDYAQLAEIEDFAWLTLTYLDTEREFGAPVERLPHLPGTDARRRGRNARQVAKKFSLFSVVRVSTRNLDREPSEDGVRHGGGTPKRRHPVKGHFKMQAYGPGWSKHRLKWYRAHYSGTVDAPAPIPLHLVRTANRLAA